MSCDGDIVFVTVPCGVRKAQWESAAVIIVYGIIETTSESISALTDVITNMERATREEAGCIDYTFSISISDPECIRVSEKWESIDALKAHMVSPHMGEFQQAIAEHPPRSVEIKFFQAEEIDLS
jgi:quinol monooxygenase YgiN